MIGYIEQLSQAVTEVFQTMIFIDLRYESEFVATPWPPERQVTAMVGLGGEESGLIYLHCHERFAFHATNSMLGMDVGDDQASVIDAMGEIANMVGGSFKAKVPAFENYRLSLPSVIVGRDYQTHTPHGHEGRDLWFSDGDNKVLVQLILKR